MVETQSFVNEIAIAVITAVLTVVGSYWILHRQILLDRAKILAEANMSRDTRIVELEKQLAVIAASIVPISTAFQSVLIKELTHYHTPELDALMQKIGPPSVLTQAEMARLEFLLRERGKDMGDMITDSERDAAQMLPLVMRRAKIETESDPTVLPVGTLVQFVSLPISTEKDPKAPRMVITQR